MDRFPVLRGISMFLKVLAVLVLIIGLIAGIGAGNVGNTGIVGTLAVWIVAATYAIGLWASAEMIGVLLAIEENTRQSSASSGSVLRAPSTPSASGTTPAGADRPASGSSRDNY